MAACQQRALPSERERGDSPGAINAHCFLPMKRPPVVPAWLLLVYPCTAAAIASPISVVLACAAEIAGEVLAAGDHRVDRRAGCGSAAAVAFGSLRLRPSQASSIWPEMIMA